MGSEPRARATAQVPVVGDEDVGPGSHAVDAADLCGLVPFTGDEEVDLSLPTQ